MDLHLLRRLGAAAALLWAAASMPAMAATAAADTAAPSDATLLQRGAYLATAADCVACHTAAGGRPYAGGNPIASPVGTIWSSNITPSKTHGIGNYTEAQFIQALRQGVRADGAHLYPAMPYTSYTKLSDDDVHALYAYFMHGVAPVEQAAPATALPFPFNARVLMAGWNLLFSKDERFQETPGQSQQWLRGAYLSEALGHCATCHTPRNVFMAEDGSRQFAGASLGQWYAPNISSDPVAGIGGWSQEELAAYLQSGHARGRSLVAGPMAEAIDNSFSKLSAADLTAIAVYIKSAAAMPDASVSKASYSWGTAASDETRLRGNAPGQTTGASLYSGNCASCHQPSGDGTLLRGTPSLLHVAAVGRSNPDNLIMAILHGIDRSANGSSPAHLMPAFAHELNDQEVALLATYVRHSFGNPEAAEVSAAQVQALRAPAGPGTMVTAARVAIGATIVLLLLLAAHLLRRRRPAR